MRLLVPITAVHTPTAPTQLEATTVPVRKGILATDLPAKVTLHQAIIYNNHVNGENGRYTVIHTSDLFGRHLEKCTQISFVHILLPSNLVIIFVASCPAYVVTGYVTALWMNIDELRR